LTQGNAEWEITRYSGVEHGFTAWGGGGYSLTADYRSWESMLTAFEEILPVPAMMINITDAPSPAPATMMTVTTDAPSAAPATMMTVTTDAPSAAPTTMMTGTPDSSSAAPADAAIDRDVEAGTTDPTSSSLDVGFGRRLLPFCSMAFFLMSALLL